MKQWIILIVTLLLLLVCGLWEVNYLNKTSLYALSDIEYSENLVENGNFKLAKEQLNSIDDSWNSIRPVWSIFIDHDEIGKIEERILDFKSNVEAEDKEESIKAAKELKRIFNHVVNKQRVNVSNVI